MVICDAGISKKAFNAMLGLVVGNADRLLAAREGNSHFFWVHVLQSVPFQQAFKEGLPGNIMVASIKGNLVLHY